jgi:hypothetical protein
MHVLSPRTTAHTYSDVSSCMTHSPLRPPQYPQTPLHSPTRTTLHFTHTLHCAPFHLISLNFTFDVIPGNVHYLARRLQLSLGSKCAFPTERMFPAPSATKAGRSVASLYTGLLAAPILSTRPSLLLLLDSLQLASYRPRRLKSRCALSIPTGGPSAARRCVSQRATRSCRQTVWTTWRTV